jgi:hypothetical protein
MGRLTGNKRCSVSGCTNRAFYGRKAEGFYRCKHHFDFDDLNFDQAKTASIIDFVEARARLRAAEADIQNTDDLPPLGPGPVP